MRLSNERLYRKADGNYKTSFVIPEPPKPPEKVFVWVVTYSTQLCMDKNIDSVFSTEEKAKDYINTKKNKAYWYIERRELL